MTFVFRADASPTIGTGHIVRSLAVAEALSVQGFGVALVGSIIEVPWLTQLITDSVFKSAIAPLDYQHSKNDTLVIDSYNISIEDDFIADASWAARACLVDGSTPQYKSDVYFNLAPKQTWFPNAENMYSELYVGTEYIPVRIQTTSQNEMRQGGTGVCKVVCVAGGSDPTRLSTSFRDALTGLSNEYEATIFTNDLLKADRRINFQPIGPDFQKALEGADLVLTAAGSTVWELVTRRIPFGVACAADNQRENYAFLTEKGLSVPMGEFSMEKGWELDISVINKLISEQALRLSLHERLAKFDFGGGAQNIAKKLIGLRVKKL